MFWHDIVILILLEGACQDENIHDHTYKDEANKYLKREHVLLPNSSSGPWAPAKRKGISQIETEKYTLKSRKQ
jgi:hypothetical protein